MDDFNLIGYCDSNLDGDKETKVSTSGYVMSLGLGAISWRSHKQSVPVDSIIDEEYVASIKARKEIGDLLTRFWMTECNPLTTPME